MPTVKRILVATKYRFIGDTLLGVPAIRRAAQVWPDAEISLLTGAKAHELLRNCPYVHDAIEFDPYRSGDQGLRRYFSLLGNLRSRRFDVALVLNRSFHGALTSTLGGARRRVGWEKFFHRDFLLTDRCSYNHDASEIDSYIDIVDCAAAALGAPIPMRAAADRRLALWPTEAELADIPETLRGGEVLIGMQPGASHAYKRWPAKSFARVADTLTADTGDCRIILVGGPDECDSAREMLAACRESTRSRVIDLTGALTLRGTVAALSRLNFFLGNDTAIRHCAVALDVPTLALFGPTSASKWGNANPPRHQLIASPSGTLEDIAVETVLQAITAGSPMVRDAPRLLNQSLARV